MKAGASMDALLEKVPELRTVDGRRVAFHFAEDGLSRHPAPTVDEGSSR